MKVLVITNMYPTESRPIFGPFIKDQVESLRAAGVEVDVLFVDGSTGKLNYLRGVMDMRRMLHKSRYDVVHAHYVYSGWVARMQRSVPVVVSSHGSDTLGSQGWLLRRLHPIVDAVTITSRQNQNRVGLPNTSILACGVDVAKFCPMDRAEARARLGWAPDRRTMLYVGVDVPLKRLDVIRQAYAVVSGHRSDVDLVTAVGVSREHIPLHMNAADVLVLASDTEGAPVVIREAAACNLPIVSVDVGDVAEFIEGMTNCHICERTPESMAETVRMVLEAGGRSNGREFLDRFSLEGTAQKLIAIYESVLAK